MNAENHSTAKYIVYGSRDNRKKLKLPLNEDEIKKALKTYENYLDSFIKIIEADYKKKFPEGKNTSFVINDVFKRLNIIRY